ncbi:MAG TPA: hypothetical protein VK892_02255, partial [Pyrinomonadaceae bacterium]|nr:hypothetical protein [Pyrinomonadaceae bacterium]
MGFPQIKTEQEFDEFSRNEIWYDAAKQICLRHGISYSALNRAEYSEHIIFFVDKALIIKIFSPFRSCFEREKTGLEFANGKTSLKIPEIIATGKFENYDYLITTQLPGELMKRDVWLQLSEKEQIPVISRLAVGLKEIHSHNADSLG